MDRELNFEGGGLVKWWIFFGRRSFIEENLEDTKWFLWWQGTKECEKRRKDSAEKFGFLHWEEGGVGRGVFPHTVFSKYGVWVRNYSIFVQKVQKEYEWQQNTSNKWNYHFARPSKVFLKHWRVKRRYNDFISGT